MIDGVQVKKLVRHADERGFLMEMLRGDDGIFSRFGQAYVSLSYPGVVRAWHFHKLQDDLITAVAGMAKVVVYDAREGSATRGEVDEFFVGDCNPLLVRIPREVHHGYKAIGTTPVLVVNFPTEPYNAAAPDEYRFPFDSPDVPYDWDIAMR